MDANDTTPFDDAWQYIANNSGSAAEALAKLYLSLWNHHEHPYPLADCIPPLDSERLRIAKGMVGHYLEYGAGDSVHRHAKDILAKYPKLSGEKRRRRNNR